jgi:TrpR-related protein YerC/YecD
MGNWHSKETDELFSAIASLRTVGECYSFFEDVCTIKEITEMAQRLRVAKMLSQGISYQNICKETGVSTATISRVNKCLEYGNGGYRLAMDRMTETEKNS